MARRRISHSAGQAALAAWAEKSSDRNAQAAAVRYLLEELTERAPGNSVEVRVPPYGVAQCMEGPQHTRGTPPNIVELDAAAWLDLATGAISWAEARAANRVQASGTRADLSAHLPLTESPNIQ